MQVSSKEIKPLTKKQIAFLTSESVLAERMRYLLVALEGYKVPWMLAEVLLQSNNQERKLWQLLEDIYVCSKKCNDPLAKEFANVIRQLVNQGWLEFRLQTARDEGLNLATSLAPKELIEKGQQLQFSANPYDQENKALLDSNTISRDFNAEITPKLIEAWREGFHNYLCLVREESW